MCTPPQPIVRLIRVTRTRHCSHSVDRRYCERISGSRLHPCFCARPLLPRMARTRRDSPRHTHRTSPLLRTPCPSNTFLRTAKTTEGMCARPAARHSIDLAVSPYITTPTRVKSVSPAMLCHDFQLSDTTSAFECPFPGCGRKFNVNSNMRRHLRNHTAPSARSSNHTPYTYPLTTCPRNYSFNTSSASITSSRSPSSSVASSPRAVRRPHLSDSEDDSEPHRDSGLYWDAESDVEDASGQMRFLRLRSRSSPGARLSPVSFGDHSPESVSALLGLQRSRSTSCSQPGCQCTLPAALHPSESQRLPRQ